MYTSCKTTVEYILNGINKRQFKQIRTPKKKQCPSLSY